MRGLATKITSSRTCKGTRGDTRGGVVTMLMQYSATYRTTSISIITRIQVLLMVLTQSQHGDGADAGMGYLEPYFDLSLGETECMCYLDSPPA